MAVTLHTAGTMYKSGNAATSVVPTVPTNTNGDLLVLTINGNSGTAITTPSGWSILVAAVVSTGQTATFYRTASSEPASYTVTVASGKWTAVIDAWSGANTTGPLDTSAAATATTVPPAVTTVTDGSVVVGSAGCLTASGVTDTWSSTDTILASGQTAVASTTNVASGAAYKAAATAGGFTPNLTVSGTNTQQRVLTYALRPVVTRAGVAALTQASTLTTAATTASVQAYHDFNAGTNGATVDAATAEVTSISAIPNNGSLTFDGTIRHGADGVAVKLVSGFGAGSHAIYLQDTLPASVTTLFARVYVYLNTASTICRVLSFYTAAGALCGEVTVAAGGAVGTMQLWDSSDAAIGTSGTGPVWAVNTWARLELMVTASTTAGQMQARLYLDPDSTTADLDTGLFVSQNTGTDIGQVRYGAGPGSATSRTWWMDDVAYSNVTWLGPAPVAFLTQAATLTTAGRVTEVATAPLTQASTLTVPALVTEIASAALSQASVLTVPALVTEIASASLSQASTLTTAGVVTKIGAASLTQPAALTSTAVVSTTAAAALTQPATLTAAALVTETAAATFTQASTLATAALVTELASSALTQPAALTTAGAVTEIAAAALTQPSTLTADGVAARLGTAALTQPATLTTDAAVTAIAAAALTQAATLTASGNVGATGFLTQPATLTSSATATALAAAALTQTATLTVDALRTVLAAAQLTQDSTLAATGTRTLLGVAALIAHAALTITPPDPITHRPNAGVTGRTAAGRTIRPFTGVTDRP